MVIKSVMRSSKAENSGLRQVVLFALAHDDGSSWWRNWCQGGGRGGELLHYCMVTLIGCCIVLLWAAPGGETVVGGRGMGGYCSCWAFLAKYFWLLPVCCDDQLNSNYSEMFDEEMIAIMMTKMVVASSLHLSHGRRGRHFRAD